MKVSHYTEQCWSHTIKVWSGMLLVFPAIAEGASYWSPTAFRVVFFPAVLIAFCALFALGPFARSLTLPPSREERMLRAVLELSQRGQAR